MRWLESSSWHLTLLFLGGVLPYRVPELAALVDGLATLTHAVRVDVDGGGGRVSRHDGVAWLRVGRGAPQLIAIADRLATECPPGVTRSRPPRRTPSAHVTVARHADADLLADLRGERLGGLHASWTVDGIALLRSHLGPEGARYETLHEASLYAQPG